MRLSQKTNKNETIWSLSWIATLGNADGHGSGEPHDQAHTMRVFHGSAQDNLTRVLEVTDSGGCLLLQQTLLR